MKNHAIFIGVLLSIATGCSIKIPHTLSSNYYSNPPKTIAVMPVIGAEREAGEVFTRIVYEKLKEKGYKPISLDNTSAKFVSGKVKDNKEAIVGIAKPLRADALLFTYVKEWNKKDLKFYVSMEVGAGFELYDGNTGALIWSSYNSVSDSKVGIERDVVRLSTYRSFEPYAQRVVDISFSTLPDYREKDLKEEPLEDNQRFYYYWLKGQ